MIWTRPFGREGSEGSKGSKGSKGSGGRLLKGRGASLYKTFTTGLRPMENMPTALRAGKSGPLARFAGLLLKGSVSLDSQSPKGSLQHGYHRLTGFSGRFRSPTNPVRWCDSSSLATPQAVAEQSSAKRLSHKWHKAQHGLLCPRTTGWQGNTIRRGA